MTTNNSQAWHVSALFLCPKYEFLGKWFNWPSLWCPSLNQSPITGGQGHTEKSCGWKEDKATISRIWRADRVVPRKDKELDTWIKMCLLQEAVITPFYRWAIVTEVSQWEEYNSRKGPRNSVQACVHGIIGRWEARGRFIINPVGAAIVSSQQVQEDVYEQIQFMLVAPWVSL